MLSKRTRRNLAQKEPTPNGPCGGTGIWYLTPARHWCKMPDADVAIHVLGGGVLYDSWNYVDSNQHDAAWLDGSIVLKSKKDGDYRSVVLNSKCRWKKK